MNDSDTPSLAEFSLLGAAFWSEAWACTLNIAIEWFWMPAVGCLSPIGDDWPFGVPGPID